MNIPIINTNNGESDTDTVNKLLIAAPGDNYWIFINNNPNNSQLRPMLRPWPTLAAQVTLLKTQDIVIDDNLMCVTIDQWIIVSMTWPILALILAKNYPNNTNHDLLSSSRHGCTYSGFQAKWCKLLVALAQLLSHSGCSNACDIKVWSHTHDILPIEALKTLKYGQSKLRNPNFSIQKKLWCSIVSWLEACNFLKKMSFSGLKTLKGSTLMTVGT